MISSKGDLSYAEILKMGKTDPDLKDLGGNVRRTQKGVISCSYEPKNMRSTQGSKISMKSYPKQKFALTWSNNSRKVNLQMILNTVGNILK